MYRADRAEVELRPWADHDLPLLERLMGDPVMAEHIGGAETPEQIEERHRRYCRTGDTGRGEMFAIVAGRTAEAVGSIGYWIRVWRDGLVWETGWSVLPEYQGRGYATSAAATVIERARAERKHAAVHAFPSIRNAPSNAVCRKVGFTLLGEVRFEYPPGRFARCNDWRLDLY